ncbi:MAG: right-handed parallel beta-helix repeat-containing protein [Thermoplasmata archaeon]|nr:MAG: right-handed parallel beta-helix repeat-containing protein [Thermoplasmata archaeon]
MGRKVIAIWLSLIMMVSFVVIVDVSMDISLNVGGTTLYVNTTGSGGAYMKIQDAINASIDGDTVFVYNGTYYERIIVNKTINLIGEDRNNTVIDGYGDNDVINIDTIWVNITGFTIINGDTGVSIPYSSNNNIKDNNLFSNNFYDICLFFSSNNSIIGNNINDSNNGIYLWTSSYNNIKSNNVSSINYSGIELSYDSNNNQITYNNLSESTFGIMLHMSSSWNNIVGNNISNNYYGIILGISPNNNITDNNIYSNIYGINIAGSPKINITNNNFMNDGVTISGSELNHFDSHIIPQNNMVNGKPLHYYKNMVSIDINGISLGQIILVNCTDVNISNIRINNTDIGIEIAFSTVIMIKDNDILFNDVHGIYLYKSSNNTIIKNNVTYNKWRGIYLEFSMMNNISSNNVSSNEEGVTLVSSSKNILLENNIYFNTNEGINLILSSKNKASLNDFYYNGNSATLDMSDNNSVLTNNFMSSTGYDIYIHSLSRYNLIKGNNLAVEDWGIFIDLASYNDVIGNNVSSKKWRGIMLNEASYNNITGNDLFDNKYGVYLRLSSNNIIKYNNILSNDGGISLDQSTNNKFYYNNIIENVNQAYDNSDNGNNWNNSYPQGGNYWSDYTGLDLNSTPNQDIPPSDGIGDTPYLININSQDNYPLMEPIDNYTILNQGWNLISLPLIQADQNLIKALEMIDGYYDAVQWFDPTDPIDLWKHHKVGKPFNNDLFEINETIGFWIDIIPPEGAILLHNGTKPISNQTITLHPGWNMVGYPSLTSYNRTEGLNNLTFGQDVDLIQWYDAETQTWHDLGENDYFNPGRGYWIHASVECEWEVLF